MCMCMNIHTSMYITHIAYTCTHRHTYSPTHRVHIGISANTCPRSYLLLTSYIYLNEQTLDALIYREVFLWMKQNQRSSSSSASSRPSSVILALSCLPIKVRAWGVRQVSGSQPECGPGVLELLQFFKKPN